MQFKYLYAISLVDEIANIESISQLETGGACSEGN